jgi:hypothetical protein
MYLAVSSPSWATTLSSLKMRNPPDQGVVGRTSSEGTDPSGLVARAPGGPWDAGGQLREVGDVSRRGLRPQDPRRATNCRRSRRRSGRACALPPLAGCLAALYKETGHDIKYGHDHHPVGLGAHQH